MPRNATATVAERIGRLELEATRLQGETMARARLLYTCRVLWERGLTIDRLAELAGVNRRTILRWRRTHRWPPREARPLDRLAGQLSVSCPNCGTSLLRHAHQVAHAP